MDIEQFIKHTVDAFISNQLAPNTFEINNGLCEDFACVVTGAGFGIRLWQKELEKFTKLSFGEFKKDVEQYCEHCFILYNNKFYDAECPQGVRHPKYLPFFKRYIKSMKKAG